MNPKVTHVDEQIDATPSEVAPQLESIDIPILEGFGKLEGDSPSIS